MEKSNISREIKKQLLNYFSEYLTDRRKQLFENVIKYRTRHITVVLEDIYQPHNASAALRSCDLTGVQDVHIIENKNSYEINPDVAMGSFKWLNLYQYNETEFNTLTAFKKLKKQGYRIIATTPHKNDQTLNDISLEGKIALVYGTELTGLSDVAIANADEFLRIPMYGFTESYNISVSVALTLYTLTERLRQSDIAWGLSEEEKEDILLEWSRRSIKRSEVYEREFFNRLKK
jgi:tRNA (guanosine-2'-O-)-methyltransferase